MQSIRAKTLGGIAPSHLTKRCSRPPAVLSPALFGVARFLFFARRLSFISLGLSDA